MTDGEIIERGRRAEALLANTLLRETLVTIRDTLVAQWQAIPRGGLDAELRQREELHARTWALAAFEAQLTSLMDDALIKRAQLERAEQLANVK